MEKISNVTDRIDDECSTSPHSKQIRSGKLRKEYALKHFNGYIQKCLKRWSDIYTQSKQLTKPALPQDSYSSTTSTCCELVGENGCKWSRDVHDMRMNPSKLCDVISELRGMYKGMMESSVIYQR